MDYLFNLLNHINSELTRLKQQIHDNEEMKIK